MRVDLNSDMGEGFGTYVSGDDDQMLSIVTSANIACGFHAGDPEIMAHVFGVARQRGVAIGAHPGFPDLWGFGRRRIPMSTGEIERIIAYQVGAAQGMAAYAGHRLTYVKAHGALGNIAAANAEGVTMRAQVAPRAVGLILGLECTLHPLLTNPEYRAIAGLPLADLTDCSVSAASTGTAGGTLSVTDTVANAADGQPTYSVFYVRYFLSPTAAYDATTAIQIDERYVGALAAGQTSPSTRAPRLATNIAGGTYWIVAKADSYNQVVERGPAGEDNNVLGRRCAVR